MTSASVNNAGLDASIIPAAVKTVSSQNMQKGQDFGKIMDQAAGKTKKDNTFEVKPTFFTMGVNFMSDTLYIQTKENRYGSKACCR